MTINGINGANTGMGQMGMNPATDSYSKNLQNQIANAQKQLQELSSNEDLPLEEKMKKRQEIQKQISDLNMQLRQHQIEQRKEKQQAKRSSVDDTPDGTENTKAGNKSTGLSQAGMAALISADSSVKQARVQGSVATQLEGRAGVLQSEIKMDKGRGASTEKKEEELADLQEKAQAATSSQISTLADANKTMEEAAKEDSKAVKTDDKDEKKASSNKNDVSEKASGADTAKQTESGPDIPVSGSTAAADTTPQQPKPYVSVDIRL